MVYIYIVAAILIGLLIGITMLSIMWLAKRVETDIREKSVELLSAYDLSLEEKANELSLLEEKLKEKEEQLLDEPKKDSKEEIKVEEKSSTKENVSPYDFLNIVQRVGLASYREKEIVDLYRKIKKSFAATPENVMAALKVITRKKPNMRASSLLKELPYKTVYELSTLDSEMQEKLLKESLSSNDMSLFKEYKASVKEFSILGFYDYLKAISEGESFDPVLYVSASDYGRNYPRGLKVVIDDDICEGFVIKQGGVVYDYSIREKELS